ncbi:hypothetical protein C8A05DRAFT_43532 [Staphylotrichum tortipilum]|uniref:Uncharacterized protein n=1 Tax=Staphylotrichum tortipilum TaxID=2831512 RepID=A0AAN6RUF5_9PEZI|nr:hypothetical protein C8A05DRAFT_43532 [Staphylotrichum longicolle]
MICRACLCARGALHNLQALSSRGLRQATQRSTSLPAAVSTRSLSTYFLPQAQLAHSPVRGRQLFSTSSPTASAPAEPQEAAESAPSTAPQKPTYLSEGESKVWDLLMAEFAPTQLVVQDISGGCGSMYGIEVCSEKFRGLNMLKQQRMVNAALGDLVKEWHGVQLNTRAPPQTPTQTRKHTYKHTHAMAPARGSKAGAAPRGWAHTPSTPLLLWLGVSLPLVAWDTAYMLLRPLTMPGGSLHWPLWVPYALYGEVDGMYGFKQWHLRNPFAAAQSLLNLVESLLYLLYLALWWSNGRQATPGARRSIGGRLGAATALLGFSAAVMTVSKTILYWVLEYCSGWDNIGQNDLYSLIVLWIIPNGAWIVVPSIFMIYGMGAEMVEGLAQSSRPAGKDE